MPRQTTTAEPTAPSRTPSRWMALLGSFAIIAAILAWGAGHYLHVPQTLPIIVGAAIIGVALFAMSVWISGHERATAKMGAYLVTEFGTAWDPTKGLRASKFTGGRPLRLVINYPAHAPDHDPLWQRTIAEAIRDRMDVNKVTTRWDTRRNRVTITGIITVRTELDRARVAAERRIEQILKPMFRGVEMHATVPEWATGMQPARIDLSYGFTQLDGSTLFHRRIEVAAGLKIGGRWKATFFPQEDRGILEPRPVLPTGIRHPGVSVYDDVDPATPILYYGRDENGDDRGWPLGKKSTMPHMLCIGPTGGGKTTGLRSLVLGAVAQGIYVYGADPKRIELSPFRGFPGVFVATSPAEIATMIEAMDQVMEERYEAIESAIQNGEPEPELKPVLFILDELLVARMVLTTYHKENGGKGAPPWFGEIAKLLALARSAKVNVVIGVQRPDASLFDDGARDNLRQRLSLMRLSPQGSEMLWGNRYVGVDLPMVQGRAMASPDGDTPVEIQTYWVADPYSAEGDDRAVLEGFRARAEQQFAGTVPPADPTPYERTVNVKDRAALPRTAEEIPMGSSGDVDQQTVDGAAVDTEAVPVDGVTEDDILVLDDEQVTVTSLDETDGDDTVTLTVATDSGERVITLDRSDSVNRVLDLG